MAALGVKMLYVQVANPDGVPANQLTVLAELRGAARTRGSSTTSPVVPWFLPRSYRPTTSRP